jgi:hypothetical protein
MRNKSIRDFVGIFGGGYLQKLWREYLRGSTSSADSKHGAPGAFKNPASRGNHAAFGKFSGSLGQQQHLPLTLTAPELTAVEAVEA